MLIKNKILLAFCVLLLVITSCKKDFLEEKRDLTGVNEEVFKDPVLANAYVDYVYGLFMPPSNSQALIWELALQPMAQPSHKTRRNWPARIIGINSGLLFLM
jgi:hypothetical protein